MIRLRSLMILCVWLPIVAISQNSGPIYRAIYKMEEIKDSVNSKYSSDIIRLDISPNKSFCYSEYTWFLDSIKQLPNGNQIWDEMFLAAFNKDGAKTRAYPHRRNTFEVIKDRASNLMTTYDYLDSQYFEYTDSIKELNWTITDSITTIGDYDCVYAVCDYHGRRWEAWFCPEIPWSDGPWKLCGLPGLIIKASDTNGLYKFELSGLSRLDQDLSMKTVPKNAQKIERKKFLENRYKYKKNNTLSKRINMELGLDLPSSTSGSTSYRIGLESDYKH